MDGLILQLERILKEPQKSLPQLLDLKQKLENLEPTLESKMIKAKVLEMLAEAKRSNEILEQSINTYLEIIHQGPEVPDALFKQAGEECLKLLKFRGWNTQAIRLLKLLMERFNQNEEYPKKLGLSYLSMNDNQAAKEVFEPLLNKNPEDYYVQAHLGFIIKTEALEENDEEKLKRGVELMDSGIRNQPIDVKNLDGLFYFHLGDGYRRLGHPEKADEIFQIAAQRLIFPSFWQRSLYNENGLRAQPVWSLQETGIGRQLKEIQMKWLDIKKEALTVLDAKTGGFINETENLKDTGFWAQYDLFVQGRKNVENCAKTPLTCSLIESIPEIATNRRGQVKFSVMKSGTHVHPHSGPTNCRLRAHLGLQIPKVSDPGSKFKLRVADQYLSWKNGDMFVFDDSFDHEVWFESENKNLSRLVLIMDMWHPDLTPEKRRSLTAI